VEDNLIEVKHYFSVENAFSSLIHPLRLQGSAMKTFFDLRIRIWMMQWKKQSHS
jgi:hypothetical protein